MPPFAFSEECYHNGTGGGGGKLNNYSVAHTMIMTKLDSDNLLLMMYDDLGLFGTFHPSKGTCRGLHRKGTWLVPVLFALACKRASASAYKADSASRANDVAAAMPSYRQLGHTERRKPSILAGDRKLLIDMRRLAVA